MCTNWMNWQLVGIMGEFIVEPNNSGVLDESVSSGNLVTSQYRRMLHFRKRKMLARFKISIQMQREISNFNSNANFKCKNRFKISIQMQISNAKIDLKFNSNANFKCKDRFKISIQMQISNAK